MGRVEALVGQAPHELFGGIGGGHLIKVVEYAVAARRGDPQLVLVWHRLIIKGQGPVVGPVAPGLGKTGGVLKDEERRTVIAVIWRDGAVTR